MSTRIDALAAGLAVFTIGTATGAVMISIVGPEPEVIVRSEVTTMPAPPPRTLPPAPPKTITVTRTIERASRSSQRITVPERTAGQRLTGTRAIFMAYARSQVTAEQWPCLRQLWQRESSWNPRLVGAKVDGVHVVGIPQLRGLKVTDGWQHQIGRGLAYIEHRHGTPCAAWGFFGRNGWY